MSTKHGGYREPRNPAPASGPGRLSRRTDGGPAQKIMTPTGLPYGEQEALVNQEKTAPLAQANSIPTLSIPSAPSAPGSAGASAGPPMPFDRPTEFPDEPITHGVDIGPGAGPEALPVQHQPQFQSQGPMTQMLARFNASDMTGSMASLYAFAKQLGA